MAGVGGSQVSRDSFLNTCETPSRKTQKYVRGSESGSFSRMMVLGTIMIAEGGYLMLMQPNL